MGRYSNNTFTVQPKLNSNKKQRIYDSIIDPTIPRAEDDIYVITTIGDRLDLLSWQYYKEPSLWWIISAANPTLRKDSLYLEPGIQIRIPRDYQLVLNLYNRQIQSR
jgi:hypothetical protein